MWVPINESWGTPNLLDPRQQQHLKAMYTLTKSLDATRPVIDNDGWEHTDMTDLFAIHDYAKYGSMLKEKYKDLGKPGAKFPDNARLALIPGYEYNGTPVLLSEFGGISYIMPGQQVPEGAWGYAGLEPIRHRGIQRCKASGRHQRNARLRRHLLHAANRRRAGNQRPHDLRPQAEVRRGETEGVERHAAIKARVHLRTRASYLSQLL
jgi:hypothetical protein